MRKKVGRKKLVSYSCEIINVCKIGAQQTKRAEKRTVCSQTDLQFVMRKNVSVQSSYKSLKQALHIFLPTHCCVIMHSLQLSLLSPFSLLSQSNKQASP